MVFKVHRHPADFNLENGNELALDVIRHSRELLIGDVGLFNDGYCHRCPGPIIQISFQVGDMRNLKA